MGKTKYYRHNSAELKRFGVEEPTDVDFGKARTFSGYAKKFKKAGYKEVVVNLGEDTLWTDDTGTAKTENVYTTVYVKENKNA